MATSGTISETVYPTRKVIERAFGRCKIKPQQISAEYIDIAKQNLWLQLSSLANRGLPLWCVDKIILPLYQGQATVELPVGTNKVLNANYRSLTRLDGTYTSSAAGTVANAFDDDFATALTQTSALGNVQVVFSTATGVTTVGCLSNAAATVNLAFETSIDSGTTWVTQETTGALAYTAGQWRWFDIPTVVDSTYFRVRASSGTINAREIFIGNSPQEVPLGVYNQDNYTSLPNKSFPGQPLQYWFNRLRGDSTDLGLLYTWPVCDEDHRYGQFTVWRQRYPQDVGTLAEYLDIPQRWYNAVIWQLAADVAPEIPEVNEAREGICITRAERAWFEAQQEEHDDSSFTLTPQISVYTR